MVCRNEQVTCVHMPVISAPARLFPVAMQTRFAVVLHCKADLLEPGSSSFVTMALSAQSHRGSSSKLLLPAAGGINE